MQLGHPGHHLVHLLLLLLCSDDLVEGGGGGGVLAGMAQGMMMRMMVMIVMRFVDEHCVDQEKGFKLKLILFVTTMSYF